MKSDIIQFRSIKRHTCDYFHISRKMN